MKYQCSVCGYVYDPKVGDPDNGVLHPMEEKHYIEWIELVADGRVLRQFLKPGGAPTALFEGVQAAQVTAREYCNLHGLWRA